MKLLLVIALTFVLGACQMTQKRNSSKDEVTTSFANYTKSSRKSPKKTKTAKSTKTKAPRKAPNEVESFGLYSSADIKSGDKRILADGEAARGGAFD